MDKNYIPSPRLQFHILRHFVNPGKDYLEILKNLSGYSLKDLKKQLQIPGSKFHVDFASDPMRLWKIVQDMISGGQCRAWYSSNRKIFSFTFGKGEYPSGIGTNGIIKLSLITDEEKNHVKEEVRDGFTVQTISGVNPEPAWEMHMVLVLSQDPYIATIFPGTYAPSFPDSRTQPYEEFQENEVFWKSHAMIR